MKKNFFNLLKQQNSIFYKVEKRKQVLMKALKLTKKINLSTGMKLLMFPSY